MTGPRCRSSVTDAIVRRTILVRDDRRRQLPLLAPRRPQANDTCQGWTVILAPGRPVQLAAAPVRETLARRVRPAVVAHGQRAVAQVNDLHRVRMTALRAERVIMVAPVRRRDSARRYLGHLRSTW